VESLRLKVIQQQMQILELQGQVYDCRTQSVQAQSTDLVKQLNNETDAVRKAHGYGSSVRFNFMTGQLEDTAPVKGEKKP
jgi:TolA-binding protein